MGQDKTKLADLSSLDELEMDWVFKPEDAPGKRAFVRLTKKDLYPLFKKKEIPVKLVTRNGEYLSYFVDISQGGVCLEVTESIFFESQLVQVGFFLGQEKFISNGRIKYIRNENELILLGIEFVGLSANVSGFIAHLYSSLKLKEDDF